MEQILYLHLRVRERCRLNSDLNSISSDGATYIQQGRDQELPKCDVFITGPEDIIQKCIYDRKVVDDSNRQSTLLLESEGIWIFRTITPITLRKEVVSVHSSGGWSELRTKLIGCGWECKGRCLTSHPIMEHGTTTFREYITQEAFVKTENEFN